MAAVLFAAVGALLCAWVAAHLDEQSQPVVPGRPAPSAPGRRAHRHVLMRVMHSRPVALMELVFLVAFVGALIAGALLGLGDVVLRAFRQFAGG